MRTTTTKELEAAYDAAATPDREPLPAAGAATPSACTRVPAAIRTVRSVGLILALGGLLGVTAWLPGCGGEASPPSNDLGVATDLGVDAWTPASLGTACTTDVSCGSGHCVDGVCCDAACDSTCMACIAARTGATDGTCAPVTLGTDPDAECSAAPGTCETGACDGAGACGLAAEGQTCRHAQGACDLPEICAGGVCPADTFQAASVPCRAAASVCDVPESCTGTSAACPDDVVADSTVVCRASVDVCDLTERCDGASPTCPADGFAAPTTVCRDANGPCDAVETCSGSGASCPTDAARPSGAECRAAADTCDVPEVCDGSAHSCPSDALRPLGHVCRPAAGVCDQDDVCNGSSSACGADLKQASTTVCRPWMGVCDFAEFCDGSTNDCPSDAVAPVTSGVCSPARCTGSGYTCAPSTCTSNGDCGPGATCSGGTCVLGKRIFVTSTTYTGNLGGLSGADAQCQARATAGGLSGTFVAWMSDATTDARDRITHASVPYYVVEYGAFATVADDYADLVDAMNDNGSRILGTELGNALAGATVWTGTNANGTRVTANNANCANWTDGFVGLGYVGNGAATTNAWSNASMNVCSVRNRLYCIEQ